MRPLPLPSVVPVAGVSHRQAALRGVVEGDHVTIVAAEDNPHDPQACEIHGPVGPSQAMLGYVPSELAARLRARGGTQWDGVITEVLRCETWGLRVCIYPEGAVLVSSARDTQQPVLNQERKNGQHTVPGRDLDAPAQLGHKRVRALSGRDLGVFVRMDNGRVVVVSNDSEVMYPSSVVTLEG